MKMQKECKENSRKEKIFFYTQKESFEIAMKSNFSPLDSVGEFMVKLNLIVPN